MYAGVPEYCIVPLPRSAYKYFRNQRRLSYLETSKAKVTDLDIQIFVNKDVMTLNISMHNTQRVHVVEDSGCIADNAETYLRGNLDLFLKVK